MTATIHAFAPRGTPRPDRSGPAKPPAEIKVPRMIEKIIRSGLADIEGLEILGISALEGDPGRPAITTELRIEGNLGHPATIQLSLHTDNAIAVRDIVVARAAVYRDQIALARSPHISHHVDPVLAWGLRRFARSSLLNAMNACDEGEALMRLPLHEQGYLEIGTSVDRTVPMRVYTCLQSFGNLIHWHGETGEITIDYPTTGNPESLVGRKVLTLVRHPAIPQEMTIASASMDDETLVIAIEPMDPVPLYGLVTAADVDAATRI